MFAGVLFLVKKEEAFKRHEARKAALKSKK